MKNYREFLNAAEDLNDVRDKDFCKDIFCDYCGRLDKDDYNGVVLLLTMCVNKEISLIFAECDEEDDTKYPEIVNTTIDAVIEAYDTCIKKVLTEQCFRENSDVDMFEKYLHEIMTKGILSGMRYKPIHGKWHQAYETNEWNTSFRREERNRDMMKHFFIAQGAEFVDFTKKYKIEIPYLYVFAWDIVNFGSGDFKTIYEKRNKPVKENEHSYMELLPRNLKVDLTFLSEELLEIFFEGRILDREKLDDAISNEWISYSKIVYFVDLLPTVFERDEVENNSLKELVPGYSRTKCREEQKLPWIKKEVLKKIPLVPQYVDKRRVTKATLKVMVDVLKEENRTELLKQELQEVSEAKSAMVSDFTHRYKNLAADNLYEIAQALLTNCEIDENLREKGRELLIEYDNKQMLTREVIMLNLEHTDQFEELERLIRSSVCTADEGINCRQLVGEAAKRVLIRVLVSGGENRIESIRDRFDALGIDTWELLEKYEKDILKDGVDCIEWINHNMCSVYVEISGKWNEIYLYKNAEGSVFLMGMIMELLFNMFTYADIKADKQIKFFSEDNYLMLETSNSVDNTVESYTGKGISSRNRIISKLNYGKNYKCHDSIVTKYDEIEQKFLTRITMKKQLFI